MSREYEGDKDIIVTCKQLTYAAFSNYPSLCKFVNEQSIKQENIQQIVFDASGFHVIYFWHYA